MRTYQSIYLLILEDLAPGQELQMQTPYWIQNIGWIINSNSKFMKSCNKTRTLIPWISSKDRDYLKISLFKELKSFKIMSRNRSNQSRFLSTTVVEILTLSYWIQSITPQILSRKLKIQSRTKWMNFNRNYK